jgi:hypothetical protein
MSENAIDLQQYKEAKEELEKLLEQEKSVIKEIAKKRIQESKRKQGFELKPGIYMGWKKVSKVYA